MTLKQLRKIIDGMNDDLIITVEYDGELHDISGISLNEVQKHNGVSIYEYANELTGLRVLTFEHEIRYGEQDEKLY
jgi:hypothetical protein